LVFAGLYPDAEPPSMKQDPPSKEEMDLLNAMRVEILVELEEQLRPAERPRDRLLEWVCFRSASIRWDPGWVELHFSLDDVSTELRRAGLDTDPGYVPWLGKVIKFIYE
jgi:hypothetical protein